MRYTSVLLVLWITGYAGIASAGSFADGFRRFIVDGETPARPAQEYATGGSAGDCLGCHDGSSATHITARAAGSRMPIRGSRTTDHPVGMLYDQSVRKDPQGYRPMTALDPNIRLVNGEVACITCHRLKNDALALNALTANDASPETPDTKPCTSSKEMTVGPRDRELCLACHIK